MVDIGDWVLTTASTESGIGSVISDSFVDPVSEFGDTGVDTGFTLTGTSLRF